MRRLYYEYYYGDTNPAQQQKVSRKIISNVIKGFGWSKKGSEYRNINQNPTEGYWFLRGLAHISPKYLIDIDESGVDNDDYGCGKGYAPIGEKYMRTQFVIRGKHLTLLAAVNILGIIPCYKIFEDAVDEHSFGELLDELQPFIAAEDHSILDNASIHKTVLSRTRLEQTFNLMVDTAILSPILLI